MSNNALVSGGVVLDVTNRSGNVWISSNKEYQDYFSKIPFGGKLYVIDEDIKEPPPKKFNIYGDY